MTPGRKKFGFTPAQRKVVAQIKLMARTRKGGVRPSLASIARDLNNMGLETGTGKQWRAQGVKNVLGQRPVAARTIIKKTSLSAGDYLTVEQLAQVFRVAGPDRMIIAVLVGSGLRASELCALEVRDLGITGGKCQIDVRRGKGAKQRSVFIAAELAAQLRDFVALRPKMSPVFENLGSPLLYDTLYKKIKKIGRAAGLADLHPHTFRHTFGTLLYHYRKDLFFVSEQLGHSKVDTTQIYAKTLTESKLEQMQALGAAISDLEKLRPVTDNTSKPESRT